MLRQFGSTFEPFGVMRRRRNELEYPVYPDEAVDHEEAEQAVAAADAIIDAAHRIVGHLGLF
ncbi:hypothetical protein [Thermoactinospora rubra]|uniref:hypothetical protein n=1 Tax=Thermoactinospora rubra TaxID=1088767 RepID=UPI000A103CA8|nr:hypothetical protein [Thermoactinospora rubra]